MAWVASITFFSRGASSSSVLTSAICRALLVAREGGARLVHQRQVIDEGGEHPRSLPASWQRPRARRSWTIMSLFAAGARHRRGDAGERAMAPTRAAGLIAPCPSSARRCRPMIRSLEQGLPDFTLFLGRRARPAAEVRATIGMSIGAPITSSNSRAWPETPPSCSPSAGSRSSISRRRPASRPFTGPDGRSSATGAAGTCPPPRRRRGRRATAGLPASCACRSPPGIARVALPVSDSSAAARLAIRRSCTSETGDIG